MDYFEQMLSHLKQLTKEKEVSFTYLSSEVPIFHLLNFPILTNLKLYIWDMTNWNTALYNKSVFNPDLPTKDLSRFNQIRTELLDCYLTYAGTEIWHLRMLDSIIQQIKYIVNSLMINTSRTIDLLIDSLNNLYYYLFECCNNGYKSSLDGNNNLSNQIEIYHNSIIDSSNVIYVKNPSGVRVYTMFDNPNFLNCANLEVSEHIHTWLEKVIKHSDKISTQGLAGRQQFFKQLRERLDKGINEIKVLSQLYYN